MTPPRQFLRQAAVSVAALATAPYVTLKLMWLSGSTIGMPAGADHAEMSSTRFVVGNVITVLMVIVAVAFLATLARPSARRVPASLVLVLGAGATGLLAPILLGLPAGVLIQLTLEGSVGPADDTGLAPWVFAVVYSGFGVLAAAIAVLVASYVLERWGHLVTKPPKRPSPVAAAAGALGLLPFGAAMIWWGVQGPGATGPQGMDQPAQRTLLIVTGLLSLAAYVVPLLSERAQRWPRTAWLVTWTGACTSALQAPTQILLAHGGDVRPSLALLALVTVPGSCIYGLTLLRNRAAMDPKEPTPRCGSSNGRPATLGQPPTTASGHLDGGQVAGWPRSQSQEG